jgi:hypothetical protein
MQFAKVRSSRSALDGDATTDVDTGASPVTRWLTYAFDYADRVSNAGGTAWVINCLVPRGSLVFDAMVRLDQPGTTPIWIRDADAVYVNKTSDISAGATGPQYYVDGGVVVIVLATTLPTQGRAVLFLATISYNEPQNSEWT